MADVNFQQYQGDYELYIDSVKIEAYSKIKFGKKNRSSNSIFSVRPFSINFEIPSFYKSSSATPLFPATKDTFSFDIGSFVELKKGFNTIFYGVIKSIKEYDSAEKKQLKITCEDIFRTLDNEIITTQTFTSEETYDINNNIPINSLINSLNTIIQPLYNVEIEELEDNLQVDIAGVDTKFGYKTIQGVSSYTPDSDGLPSISNQNNRTIATWDGTYININQNSQGWGLIITLQPATTHSFISGSIEYNINGTNLDIKGKITYSYEGTYTITNIGCNYDNKSIFKILLDICKITQKQIIFNETTKKIEFIPLFPIGNTIENFEYFDKQITDYYFNANFSIPNSSEIKVNFEEVFGEYDNAGLILTVYEFMKENYKNLYTKKIITGSTDLSIKLDDKIDNYIVNSIDYKDYGEGYLQLELIGNNN